MTKMKSARSATAISLGKASVETKGPIGVLAPDAPLGQFKQTPGLAAD